MGKLAMQNQVVIKRPLLGNILFTVIWIIFIVAGVLVLQVGTIVGIVFIMFFGVVGFLFLVFLWKPIAIVSDKGITVPYRWRGNFVSWEIVSRFEVVEQSIAGGRALGVGGGTHKQRYIGIFVTDTTGIAGTGKTHCLLINSDFSFIKIEKIMEILQKFYDEHKSGCTK